MVKDLKSLGLMALVLLPFVLMVAVSLGLWGCGSSGGLPTTSLSLAAPGWGGPYEGKAGPFSATWSAQADAYNRIGVNVFVDAISGAAPAQTVVASGTLKPDGTFTASGLVTTISPPIPSPRHLTLTGTWGAENGVEYLDGTWDVDYYTTTGTFSGQSEPSGPPHAVPIPGAYQGTATDNGITVTTHADGSLAVAMPLGAGNPSTQTGQILSDGTITGSGTVDGTSITVTSAGTWKIEGGIIKCHGTWHTSAPVGGSTDGVWDFDLPPHS